MSAQAFRSAIGRSSVRHRRHRPRTHELELRTLHVLIDIDELPELDRRVRGFAYDRAAPMAIRSADHLRGERDGELPGERRERGDLRGEVARLLAEQGVALPAGRLQLLCHPRTFGHVFDPVAWWFAYHPDGQLGLVLAEVTSTFGDRDVYVLDALEPGPNGTVRASADKRLHVSPFLPVDGLRYRFVIRPPGAEPGGRALVHMEVEDADGLVLDATQRVELIPMRSRTVLGALVRFPFVSLRSLVWIHVHALLLWGKRVPFHRRPEPPAGALRVRGRRATD
jgi:uncharacterized protein